MQDPFTTKVTAAAVAGWWTVLVAALFTTLLWITYWLVMAGRPGWALEMWGPDMTWTEVQRIFLGVIVAFKFCLWMLVLAVIWLTLWGRQLKKRTSLRQPGN